MNSKLKKRCIRCGALMAATAVVAGIFFQTTLSVEAAMEKMPGIETIVKDNSKDKPFRILELTDNSEDAEIGYYISGQEPSVKLYTYEYQDASGNTQTVHFQTFEEGLAKLPEIQRKEFAMNVKLDENGNINADASTGIQKINMTASDADTVPLSYSDYQEKYFLDNSDRTEDWTKIDLTDLQGKNRTDTVKINGTYQENAAGNGNYTKEEQKYYPIREGVESDQQQPEKFRENIESFSYVEAESDDDRAAYFLQFAPVNNSDVNAAFSDDKPTAQTAQQKIQEAYDATAGNYGYYENVYTDLTEEIVDNLSNKKFTFPGENPGDDVSNALLIRNHQLSTAGQTTSLPVLGGIQDADLAGSQEDPYIYLGKNIDSYPYYQYALVGDLKYVIQKAQESAAADTQAVDETDGSEATSQAMATTADPQDGDTKITLEDGQYWYWQFDAADTVWTKTVLSIVTGRQAVSYQDVQKLPDTLGYNYYYQVDKAWFCCQAGIHADSDATSAKYYGWYYPSYPAGEDVYLPVDSDSQEVPTYYISEAAYTLTPGTGDYDFVPGGTEEKYVQVDKIYYKGGYTNADWLKRYVFHLEPSDEAGEDDQTWNNFTISVDVRQASDWKKAVYASASGSTESLFEDAGDINPKDYDLIYINGTLSQKMAESIQTSQVPCIVNIERGLGETFQHAFSAYLKSADEDTDGSYVSYQIYFYKNTFLSSTGTGDSERDVSASLITSDFKTAFSATQQAGFEDITRYIDQENAYRALGKNEDASDTTTQLEPLSSELSMARALEYVINYRYKRNVVSKSTINVLEIMPDKDCKDYDDLAGQVENWLGLVSGDSQLTITGVCCAERGYDKENINDDLRTYWHTLWNGNIHPNRSRHYIVAELDKPEDIKGFRYTPRATDNGNGILQTWTVECYDEKGQLIQTIHSTEKTKCQSSTANRSTQNILFTEDGDIIPQVKKIKLYFDTALRNDSAPSTEFAVCANLGVIPAQSVQVTSITASEFVGHIDDLASEYDMIYIDANNQNKTMDAYVTGGGTLRYTHVGGGVSAGSGNQHLTKLLGQLDNEFVLNSDGTKYIGTDGLYRFAPLGTYNEEGGGYFRGSGNDITEQKMEELLDFVRSGYPVVLGDYLVSNGNVNTNAVDNASYYYEFMTEALKYENVLTEGELNQDNSQLEFFANLAKPVIEFVKNGSDTGKPLDAVRAGESEDTANGIGYIQDQQLRYTFKISNDSDASPALTTYDCNLYLDLNFDGNLSDKESQDKYIAIQDENGKVMSQVTEADGSAHYELQAGKTYTLTRKIPADYYKLLTWKLEVFSNQNHYIHSSEVGYAKQKNTTGTKQVINVLQLLPNGTTNRSVGNWDLKNDKSFQNMIASIEDFQIVIQQKKVDEINAMTSKQQMEQLLSNVQMLVIGFDDTYQNISNDAGQVAAILDYVKKGKSIIFAHDTTSYVNYDYTKMTKSIPDTAYGSGSSKNLFWDQWLHNHNNLQWGLSLNTVLRSVVGMDRYGITSDEKIQVTSTDGEASETTVSALLKQGSGLNGDGQNQVSFEALMQAAGDVAYRTTDGRNSSYAQTQSYTNNLLHTYILGTNQDGNQTLVYQATKVNDGAITEYPYRMGDTIGISKTHGQYYQLAMEQDKDINGNSDGKSDIVVWYCLTDGVYGYSPNDVRNNYYFYSKGNVIYTGTGHESIDSNKKEELQLFINAMVAAANVTAVKPEVDFVDSLDPNADIESARYYATDQSSWRADDGGNLLEKDMDFYINVKDYNMVSADLNQEDLDKQKMEISFFIDDANGSVIDQTAAEGGTVDGAPTANEKVTDITKTIGTLYSYDGTTLQESGGKFNLTDNNTFRLTLTDIEQYLKEQETGTYGTLNGYKTDCKLYVRVKSTVYLYGQENSNISWASIDLKQRQLFELN